MNLLSLKPRGAGALTTPPPSNSPLRRLLLLRVEATLPLPPPPSALRALGEGKRPPPPLARFVTELVIRGCTFVREEDERQD